jgi:NAD(P)-dependent dehydrogenase (short-subunit alcohol dehydrogenase family)
MHPFAPGLLDGRAIALSGAVPDSVRELLEQLGARVGELDPWVALDEERAAAWADAVAPLDALVCGPGSGEGDPKTESGPSTHRFDHRALSLEQQWAAVSALANASFIPARRGRIALLAPRPDGHLHVEAVQAALENLARTLSVEWARFGITTVAIAPGPASSDEEIAMLVAFLCSPAGGYFSGCRFDLGRRGSAA